MIVGLTDMKLIRTITTLLTLLLCVATGCQPPVPAPPVSRQTQVQAVQKEIPKQRFSQIDHVIEEEIEKGNLPGAVVLIGKHNEILYWEAFGNEVIEPFEEPICRNTIFDLAHISLLLRAMARRRSGSGIC